MRLFQGPVKNSMDILDSFRGQPFIPLQIIVHGLYHGCCQLGKLDCSDVGDNVQFYMILIGFHGCWLHIANIVPEPCFEPLRNFCFRWLCICPVVYFGCNGRQFLPYFLLGLAVDGFLNLLPGFGVKTERVSCFPASVRAFADGSAALGAACLLLCQNNLAFLRILESWFSQSIVLSFIAVQPGNKVLQGQLSLNA